VVQAPAPSSNRAASERTGLSRNDVSLLGVFGSSKDRYALLRLPNGSVKRVGAGDSLQGVRVAAISSDAVRLTQGQRDTVLRMPD
jgi:type IV pilus biogenesis protein PilP